MRAIKKSDSNEEEEITLGRHRVPQTGSRRKEWNLRAEERGKAGDIGLCREEEGQEDDD